MSTSLSAPSFSHGRPKVMPYLLAPTAHTVTVAWEGCRGGTYRVAVDDPQAHVPRQVSFTPHVDGDGGVYHLTVDGLSDDRVLGYRILWYPETADTEDADTGTVPGVERQSEELTWQEVACGTVRIPSATRTRTRMLVMSDSHAFNLRRDMQRVARGVSADLALHLGDIPAGTGVQKEQYQQGWFEAFAPVLADLPFIYAPGNHDDGPHLDTYVGAQARSYGHDPSGRCLSLDDPSGVHLVVLDSNPWGLTEMNAMASGGEVPAETTQQIASIEDWLAQDLASEPARQASWRVVVMHHPYSDRLTNQRLASLLESGHVDLVLSGHLHHYDKAVPVGTGPVPRPVYLTLPSCQDPASELIRTDGGTRLMEEFPEVVAQGNGSYTIVDAEPERLVVTVYAIAEPGATPSVTDTVVLTSDDRPGDLQIGHVTWRHIADNLVEVRATATNTGRGIVAVTPTLIDNGVPVTVRRLGSAASRGAMQTLDAGESVGIVFTYCPGPGAHELDLSGARTRVLVPEMVAPQWTSPDFALDRLHSTLSYTADLTNPTDCDLGVTLELIWDGQVIASRVESLAAGHSQRTELKAAFQEGGCHSLALVLTPDDPGQTEAGGIVIDSRTVECGGGIGVVPHIRDRSGWGNHALVRGCPRLVSDDTGRSALALEEDGDYLEVPASPSVHCGDSFAARVRAKVQRLALPGEMAHNPLMQRGLSVGWGATYHLRMVVDRNGTMKWGSCHGTTEFGWAGGRTVLGEWADYEMRLSPRGGVSMIDGTQTAKVPGPGGHLSDYSDKPLFVGYSYIGHVIEQIGRPKYYTHLPATVSEVVYAVDADADLNECSEHRRGRGAGVEGAVRVDLDMGDIRTSGRYTSAWRQVRYHQPDFLRDIEVWCAAALVVSAQVPDGCRARIRVETSMTRLRVDDVAEVEVRNGINRVALPKLRGAWFRIVCDLEGCAEFGERIRAPFLQEASVEAERLESGRSVRRQLRWSTLEEWAQGQCDGAIGTTPVDRLHVFEEFTDPIHG